MVDPKKLRRHPWYRGPGAPGRKRIATERLWRELQTLTPEMEEIRPDRFIDEILREIGRMMPEVFAGDRRTQVKNGSNQREFTVGPRPRLVVDAHAGDVTITGRDTSVIRVQTDDDDEGVNASQQGDVVRVGGDWPGHGPGADYHIEVPRGCDVTVNAVQGDIEIEGTRGPVTVETANGDVSIAEAGGECRVHTASGEVTAQRVTGNLTIESASGDVEVSESGLSSFNISTASGDAEVETGLRQDGSYRFKTMSGDLTLKLPRDTRATVRLHSRSGEVDCNLPAQVTEKSRRHWEGKLNGGGVVVEMSSMSGDLEIEESRCALTAPAPPEQAAGTGSFDPMPEFEPFSGDEPQSAAASDVPAASSPESSAVLEALARGEIGVDEAMAELDRLGA